MGGQSSRGENSYGIEVRVGERGRQSGLRTTLTRPITRLQMMCKDLRLLRFSFAREHHSRRSAFELLQTLVFPASSGKVGDGVAMPGDRPLTAVAPRNAAPGFFCVSGHHTGSHTRRLVAL